MPSQIIEWVQTHFGSLVYWFLIVLAISAAVTVITNFKKIFDYVTKKLINRSEIDSLMISIEHESNPRFGFSFLYPARWDRFDPANGDGNTFVHPEDEKTKILAWGSNSFEASLNDELDRVIEHASKNKEYNLIKKTESGRYIRGEKTRSQIDGMRIEYSYKDEDNVYLFVMQSITYYEDRTFSVMCQTRLKYKGQFSEDFLNITGSLVVNEEMLIE